MMATTLRSSTAAAVRPIRLLIVDDSAVARAVFSRMITSRPDFQIVHTVASADAALAFLAKARVDIILLDIEMPGMDGLTALPRLLAASEGARVLIVSSSCDEGATATMRALTLGAADTLAKPGRGAFGGRFADVMVEKLLRMGHAAIPVPDRVDPAPVVDAVLRPVSAGPIDCLAIGASTGGLHALSDLLRRLPLSFDAPILITQHLPPVFMPFFAAQIREISGRPTNVAHDGARLRRGQVLVAPGEGHLVCHPVGASVMVRITQERVESGCMPSVDPMLSAVAQTFGPAAIGVVLSGMGRDGVRGAADLATAGGDTFAQDRDSSVVWGMPGAIAAAGLASAIVHPAHIADLIVHRHLAAS